MSLQTISDFRAAERWLHTLIIDRTPSPDSAARTPDALLQERQAGLARLGDFLGFAGSPQASFPAIHVAGTSGKGSVVSLIAAILAQAGKRVGQHVSPYLQVSSEKLCVNGRRISAPEFIELVRAFRALHGQWRERAGAGLALRYGEAWLALTFLWLARAQVDWAVVEAEVGGRYDPSNLLPARLAVITNVELDHVETLGPTLADIAHHKAGIIKADQLVVTGVTDPALLRLIEAEAREKAARLYRLGRDFDFTLHAVTAHGTRFSVRTPHHVHENLTVALPGGFQAANAALAVTAVDVLAAECGFGVTPDMLRTALLEVRFPGRMEIVQREPVVILDGAHNPHKMTALAATLQALYPGRPLIVVIGVLAAKDATAMLAALAPLAPRWIVTQPHVLGKPPLPPAELAAAIRRLTPHAEIETSDRVGTGIARALQLAELDTVVLVTGSLYMLGEARNRWVSPDDLILGS